MDAGTIFDWVGRVFGIAFLLFVLFVLMFPGESETPDDARETRVGRDGRSRSRTTFDEASAARDGTAPAGVPLFSLHRRGSR